MSIVDIQPGTDTPTSNNKKKRFHCLCLRPKSEEGAQLYETLGLEGEISMAVRKLKEWAAPRPVEKNLLTISDTVYIRPEPLGVVLVIGAWNYPWAVTIHPLIGAIAAGNVYVDLHMVAHKVVGFFAC